MVTMQGKESKQVNDLSFYNKLARKRSSAGSSGLKPMKVPVVQQLEPEGPPLPPRNYKVEDLDKRITKQHVQTTIPTHSHSHSLPGTQRVSQAEPAKSYENIKSNNNQADPKSRNDEDRYDQDYTKQLRKFSASTYKPQRGLSFSSTSHTSPSNSPPHSTHSYFNQSNPLYNPQQIQPQETNMDDFANELPVPIPRKPQQTRDYDDVSPPLPPKTDVTAFQSVHEDRIHPRRSMPTSRYEHRLEPNSTVLSSKDDDNLPPKENLVRKSPFINADLKMQAIVSPQVLPRTPPSERKASHQTPPRRYGDVRSIHATPGNSSISYLSNLNSVSTNLNTAISPGEDTTITSAPPDAINRLIERRRSLSKSDRKHSEELVRGSSKQEDTRPTTSRETIASSLSQDEITPTRLQSKSKSISVDDLMAECERPSRPSPPYRRTGFRETEFSADSDVPIPTGRKSSEAAPIPYKRYNKSIDSERSLDNSMENLSGHHSRQSSAELLEIMSPSKPSPIPARRSSPANLLRVSPQELNSGSLPLTPAPRKSSSSDLVMESPTVSRHSTPSPNSSGSRTGKISPTFQKISDEFVEALREKGINIKDKQTSNSDETKDLNKVDHKSSLKVKSCSAESLRAPQKVTMRHIRQKSSDELLLDDQVESLSKCIKDDEVTSVFNGPSRAPKDYIPGLFDEDLTKIVPRRSRTSMDSTSPCHSKQSSAGDDLNSDTFKLADSASKKEELLMVLRKKLCILEQDQTFLQSELEDNALQGEQVLTVVKALCNGRELDKYTSYVEQIEEVTKLLLRLSRRLAKAENALFNVPSGATDDEKKCLEQKRNHLMSQYNDAKQIKESIDATKPSINSYLEDRLTAPDYQLYDTFISIRLQLTVELNDLQDQITSCKDQINAIAAIS